MHVLDFAVCSEGTDFLYYQVFDTKVILYLPADCVQVGQINLTETLAQRNYVVRTNNY